MKDIKINQIKSFITLEIIGILLKQYYIKLILSIGLP